MDHGDDEVKIKRSKIYTKTGDKGTTALFNGERRPKDDAFFQAIGAIDELNATMGMALEHCANEKNGLDNYLERVQSLMLDIGACCATPLDNSTEEKIARTKFSETHVKVLERWIDLIDSKLPPLKNFVVPCRVGLASAHLHQCRTVCRRAERDVVCLSRHNVIPTEVAIFINRLSDWLFVAARYAAHRAGKSETIFKGRTMNFDGEDDPLE
eukprot:gene8228-9675_t